MLRYIRTQGSEFQQHGQVRIHGDTTELRHIFGPTLIETLSVDPFSDQHCWCRVLGNTRRGEDDISQWGIGNLGGKVCRVVGLLQVVEFCVVVVVVVVVREGGRERRKGMRS